MFSMLDLGRQFEILKICEIAFVCVPDCWVFRWRWIGWEFIRVTGGASLAHGRKGKLVHIMPQVALERQQFALLKWTE